MGDLGTVYLLGAGPGDPELVTARAIRRLGEADLVLYDALIHPDLLSMVRSGAECVFVGKRAGRAGARQSSINRQMIEAAQAGRTVVRLKGGDPFLFGRGSEEAEALVEAGIPFEVVPGVPSPMAVMAYAGIPLTHRGQASSVAFLTATESAEKDRSSHDWSKLATATQTLVLFMGLRKLASLMQLLIEHGRPADTPAAVVQSASLPTQRTIVGTVGDIAERAAEAGISMPALTVVGPVVRLREVLRWYDRQPLFGRRVMVTRPTGQAGVLCRMLMDRGAEPVEAPTIRIEDPEDPGPLRQAVASAQAYDWILFTSVNGVDRFFREVARQGGDARLLGGARVAAIGPGTARGLEARGIRPDQVPSEYRGEAVAAGVLAAHGGTLSGVRVLLPRAAVARDVLPDTLREAGAEVDVVAAYRSLTLGDAEAARMRGLIAEPAVDVVTFTASSTVKNLVAMVGDGFAEQLAPLTVASIGPITTETAREMGIRVDVTATEYTNAGLVHALTDHFARRDGERGS